jgi:hypothetical protein
MSLHVHSPLRPAFWWPISLEVSADGDGLHLLKFFFLLHGLGPLAYVHSELILKFGSYRQSVELLGRGISPVARSLLNTQHKHWINANIHVSNEIRSHYPNVRVGEDSLDRAVTVIGTFSNFSLPIAPYFGACSHFGAKGLAGAVVICEVRRFAIVP